MSDGSDERDPGFRRLRSGPVPPHQRGARTRAHNNRPAGIPSAGATGRRFALLLAAAMSILVLLASGTAWALTGWASGQLNRDDVFGGLADGDRPAAGPKGALNILVIGSDSRGAMNSAKQDDLGVGRTSGQRSDTMMLVHVNNDRDRITVVGIPRDSWVPVPGHGANKINAAYAYGGPELAISTVEGATGVRVDHYVEVNFTGFVDVVDAVDGIEVCLDEPISDEKAHLEMPAGTHRVDGKTALAFARTRKTADGDLDRIDRQQQVMAALLNKAMSSETLSDPAKFTAFLDTSLGAVTVDEGLDTATINQLGNQLRTIGLDDMAFTQVPIGDMDYRTPSGEVALRWNDRAADAMFDKIAADEPLTPPEKDDAPAKDGEKDDAKDDAPVAPGDITVEVFNGVGTPGLGSQAARDLDGAGFDVSGDAQNWSTKNVPETLVRYAPDQKKAAKAVAKAVPGAVVEEDDTLSSRVQVVLGFNYTRVEAPEQPAQPAEPEPTAEVPGRDSAHTSTARDNVCAK
ncbi:LytR family transcriptional attenuator [Murinocardiopsis flavida]|uniref:LytR family transcriptional attenuator n=1 Tax=Murinocardiopsis flavida TaxID=645275 RepID=A0A2P8DIK1_9ACTN|nr:LCP family protein [Murinocardiopsis flavida]PSK97055.1 LytR family transcriptional attenuator [Murinocardiopsis flavida]